MILKLFVFLAAMSVPAPAALFAQDSTACQCQPIFDVLSRKLKENYVGYALRKSEWESEVDSRINDFRTQFKDTSTIACVAAIQKVLTFFHDGHLFVSQMPEFSDAENDQFKNSLRKRMFDRAAAILYLAKNRSSLADIEGVWTDGTSRFGIVHNDNKAWPYQFVAIVLESATAEKVGELKIGVNLIDGKYIGVYYTNGYSPRYVELSPEKDNTLLGIWGGLLWGRVEFSDSASISSAPLYDPSRPTLAHLDSSSVLLTIPTFLVDKQVLDTVLLSNLNLLESCRYLVIDIRGNSGGNGIYFDLMSLYASKPIVSEIGMALASEDNLAYFSRFAGKSDSDPYRPVVDDMKKNMGTVVKGPRFATMNLETIPAKVEKVAILTDHTNISAAETFILHSKMASEKVVTIGSNTGGVVDYNNINMIKISCNRLGIYFGYPMFTMNDHILKDGYNGKGIRPDIPSDKRSRDLVDFALTCLKK